MGEGGVEGVEEVRGEVSLVWVLKLLEGSRGE